MKTEEKRNSIIVAIFVFLALVIFLAGIFVLGGQQNKFARTITVKAVFEDVEGLSKGNNIWFSGVKVGTVKDINFAGDARVEVNMRIEKDATKYIRKDCRVKISSDGLIGNRIMVIVGGTSGAPEIEEGDYLAIEEVVSTENMMNTLQENNENLVSITRDLKVLLSGIVQGEGTVGALLTDTLMVLEMQNVLSNFHRVSANTARASNELSLFTAKLNTPGNFANELVTDTIIFARFRDVMEQMQQLSLTTTEISQNLNAASEKLNTTDNAMGLMLNDEQFARNMTATMHNLESSSKKLDETLEALRKSFLLRGAFR